MDDEKLAFDGKDPHAYDRAIWDMLRRFLYGDEVGTNEGS